MKWAFILFCLILLMILWPGGQNKETSMKAACMSKPKGIGLALLLYSEDHNDLLPPRDTWMDVLTSAPSAAESVERSRQPLDPEPSRPTAVRFWCPYAPDRPSGGFGYAMNSSLDGRRLTTIPSARTFPLVYDSINYSRNASDPFLSIPPEGRHKGKNSIVHADGHVAGVAPEELGKLYAEHYTGFEMRRDEKK